ncbi:MAG TPA: hypothetical protein VJW23_06540, partial [Propionibacteriaceae bacterium]|nr:hypothetical protein [Propionibacteriaceae bacterium]
MTCGDTTFPSADEPPLAHHAGATGTRHFAWTPGRLSLLFTVSKERPTVLSGIGAPGTVTVTGATQPLVELIITGD